MSYGNGNKRYNNNRNYNNNNYNNSGNGYNNNRNSNRSSNQKKKSGCKSGLSNNENRTPYVQGWKADKTSGLRTFFAFPYKGTQEVESKTGRVYQNWMCKVQFKDGRTELFTCLYEPQTQKVTISDLGYVMNPKGGRGGYVGPYYVRN